MKVEKLKTVKAILRPHMPIIATTDIVRIDQELIKKIEKRDICITNEKDITQILKMKDGKLVIEEVSTQDNEDIKSEVKADVYLKENDILIRQGIAWVKIKTPAYDFDKDLKKAVDKINGYNIGRLEKKTNR
jgi:hypothetical protein